MEALDLVLLAVAAVAAGAINGAVGSGSLITLPVLLALGLDPQTAIATNIIGMVFSAFGAVTGYRREIWRERSELGGLVVAAGIGGITGAVLLLLSPPGVIDIVVPILIVVAILLVAFQPPIVRWMKDRRERRAAAGKVLGSRRGAYSSPGLRISLFGCAIYGGYFTAAQGILYLAVLGIFTGRPLGEVNGVKNLLGLSVNLMAALTYVFAFFMGWTEIVWLGSLAIAVGGALGGYFGSHIAKRLPSAVLRAVIVVVAGLALVNQFL